MEKDKGLKYIEAPKSPEKPCRKGFGLIMVKPHALLEQADIAISELLNAENLSKEKRKALNLPPLSDRAIYDNKKLEVCKVLHRDLSSPRWQNQQAEVLEIFYGRDKGKRHYPYLLDLYKGPVAIFLVSYDGSQEEAEQILREFKGKENFLGEDQNGYGIRGVLDKQIRRKDMKLLEILPEPQYGEEIKDIIDNVVHITDTPGQTARALDLLLTDYDLAEMEERGIDIKSFIHKYKTAE